MKTVWRISIYLIVFVVLVGGAGTLGFVNTMNEVMSVYDKAAPALTNVQVPKYDANKPTVAVLLANESTEVFDFLVPYEMFAMTEAYNVYGVAPDREIKSLTGGLDVVPHYSFDEMDAMLGKSPDIIVIPFMPILDEKKYTPVREWIQKHASDKTLLLSICNGAENLADTGLLNGKSAATHWGDIDRLIKQYPKVQWVKDLRYVPQGNIISSAGLTSGIDATLYVISQQLGEEAAEKVAVEMNYPSYDYVKKPQMEPFTAGLSDITFILNNAYQWNKVKAGVLLYNGVDELDLSAAFDTYAASGTTSTLTVSGANEPIVTKHGLNLVARYQIKNVPKLAKMIVVGADAESAAAKDINQWNESGNSAELLYLHREAMDRFAMDPAFEDLAKQEDIGTAKFAAKRLEYRATDHLKLEGRTFSFEAFGVPILLGILSLIVAFFIDQRFFRRKKDISASR
ncbi:DJ-1/PfpI family protein [Brevibacillus sp. M2.1A]|uniref:DJ-1/PfpI family protein n=1 Tax=Brevibacillus TaxID=55080 RepID=UPI00156ABC68|nr:MULTISPECIES: DJ-1/PfpI family protein [Brevibacillus]MCC8437325.1 DJ-1/PfpI family protein [Brevibacillus sp. M2.1A]MCE0450822.1 DJ-1/PfpI family protein [Brevibacillus sp. AF8]UKK99466.1 DJ-1/PfpI family protein [Brevibacillus brevis]